MSMLIIKRPVLTEKSMLNAEKKHSYTFLVEPLATKGQIAEAVEKAFGVTVVRVRTITIPGKVKRRGAKRVAVRQSKKKKAVVTVKEGQSISLFEVKK